MSLYVGHLSPHVRQDELERVFQRFGRCSFQLKDGYGFVVYEVTANAERALRALRGKQVCGEQISLNWSNKQPRPFQRTIRGSRFNEPYRRRAFREDDNFTGFRRSQDRREFSVDGHLPAYSHGGRRVDGPLNKETGHAHEDADGVRGNRGHNLLNALMEVDAGELNPLEHDRWGEPTTGDVLPGFGTGKGSDFDRYEPYHGYDERDEKEGNDRTSSDGSPYRDLHGKGRKEHYIVKAERNFDKSMPSLTCYNCGQVGHIKRKCPKGDDGRRERFMNLEQTRDEFSFREKVKGRMRRFRVNSWGRLSIGKDPFVVRQRSWDQRELHFIKGGKSAKAEIFERRKKHQSKLRSESHTKKYSSKKKYERRRRARESDTSLTSSSDSSKSSSRQQSLSKSTSRSKSRSSSRSGNSRSRRASSRSRSISVSSYAKSKSSKSRSWSRSLSRSRSRSTIRKSLSLSISLGQKSSSSPKNTERNISATNVPKENSKHMDSPESNHLTKTTYGEDLSSPLGTKNQHNVECSRNEYVDAHKSDSKVSHDETGICYDALNCAASTPKTFLKSNELGALKMKPGEQVTIDSMRISTQEMLSALRHYKLELHEDDPNVSVESYLGAARLWPWEMIYYRRLKRGPISTENYARRLEQNKEFGIVDKYIRSSSGWEEFRKDA